jgi:hypothetical protein
MVAGAVAWPGTVWSVPLALTALLTAGLNLAAVASRFAARPRAANRP